MLKLPSRFAKPRDHGLTIIADLRLSTGELKSILADFNQFIDIAKIGIGTAYVLPNLSDKLDLYRQHHIDIYFGGTLFEKFYHQDLLDTYIAFLRKNKIKTLEISAGSIDISLEQRCHLIDKYKNEFVILAEVGSKDQDALMSPSEWVTEVNALLGAGAAYVITEGRDSGTAGIYRPNGEIRAGLIKDLVKSVPVERLIFEAPSAGAQMFFINLLGANVNLANVSPHDAILLETQRLGLRYETFLMDPDK